METNTKTQNAALDWLLILTEFVNSRPGFQFADYGDYKAYRQETDPEPEPEPVRGLVLGSHIHGFQRLEK